jgi:phosphoenolpyruvate carboxykinase (ATP)
MQEHKVNVWMINTGWTGGAYGVGQRMKLSYTRAMITAALEGKLNNVEFREHPVFGLAMPTTCPGVPSAVLDPRSTWEDKTAYDQKAQFLASLFVKNFEKYKDGVSAEVLAAAPKS